MNRFDDAQLAESDAEKRAALREQANAEVASMLKEKTTDVLNKVLHELSLGMKNSYSRSDA